MNQKISLRLYNKEKKDAIHLIKNFWNSVPLPFLTLPSTRTPPEPGRQGQRQTPRTRWHPARILPDAPEGVLRGVGAAGICGHGWKFLTGRKPSGQGRRSATRTEPEER